MRADWCIGNDANWANTNSCYNFANDFFKVANLPKIELTGTEGSQKVLNNEKENHSGNHGNLPSHLLAKISWKQRFC